VHDEPCLLLLAGFLCERMMNDKICEKRAHGVLRERARPSIASYTCNAGIALPRPTLSPPLMRFMPHHCWILSLLPLLNTDSPLYYDCSSMRTFSFHLLIISLWIASIDWRHSIARLNLWH